jgi:hypothetical protein
MGNSIERIFKNINSFKRKYYLNLMVRGFLLTLTILGCYFLLAALLEHLLWLNSWARLSLLILFFSLVAYCVYRYLREPLGFWIVRRGMKTQQSARLIGKHFPSISDRLLNLVQLTTFQESSLVYASIQQKSAELEPIAFDAAISLKENARYFKYLIIPLVIILTLLIFNQGIITQSAHRIVNFDQKFSPQAPFKFVLQNQSLTGFFNEDFTLTVLLEGSAIPQSAYIVLGPQRLKMEMVGQGQFQYTFEKIQQNKTFQLDAAGYFSSVYEIKLINRPELTDFRVDLQYPKYLQRKDERLSNAGNLEIPEGTLVTWHIQTNHTLQAHLSFTGDSSKNKMQLSDNQAFTFKRVIKEPDYYELTLDNETSKNKDRIFYGIEVIKDQFPQLTVTNFKDSVLYKQIILGGLAFDDYGITQLGLLFHVKEADQRIVHKKQINIPIAYNQAQQSFFFNWNLDSLILKPGQHLEYYLQVWDNDGVNGRKSTRSATYTFFVPDKDQLVTDISKSQSQAEQKLEQGLSKAQNFKKQIEDAQQKLKGKQTLDWQDKKKLEDIVEQKKALDQLLNQLKEQNKLLEQKKDAFTEQDERIREKAQQIQKLMEELLDEETKKLMAELEKLLKENANPAELDRVLDKLNKNSSNLEKELDRALELFKQLQFEYKLDQAIQDLKQHTENQQSLLDKTEQREKEQASEQGKKKDTENVNETSKEKNQQLAEEQKKLNEEFKNTEEKLDELRELGEELNQEENLPEQEQGEEIDELQKESEENLKQNKPGNSKGAQQKAVEKMKKMQRQMEGMQSSMSMEMDVQNLESLRQIIHGLIKVSYDQENLIKKFRELEQNDPRFNALAQQQIKLKDDVKVLEDSLLALAKRDAMLGTFVTREVTELNSRLDKVIDANKERKRQQAATEMQLSMTTINNLALMLDSHFDMLMQMMANAKPSMKKGKQKSKERSLSQMQQQLNQRIEELKGSGKSGRQLSEELAEMAAEQERIRRALQDMQNKMNEKGGKTPGDDLPGKMEETEMDLVNKKLSDQLIKRQKEILTRLLESEKSMREQDLDDERKGETAKDYNKEIPAAVEEYLRLKEKEVELLKTVPPKLYPYYKKEVREYFKRSGDN